MAHDFTKQPWIKRFASALTAGMACDLCAGIVLASWRRVGVRCLRLGFVEQTELISITCFARRAGQLSVCRRAVALT